MWSHHSYRSWQWISPDLLPGRPCKVLSWVWSVELAVTSWVLSPRAGAGAENACPNHCHFQEMFHFFPTLAASSFSHCFYDCIPWISEYENPDKSWPAQALTGCQGAPLTLVESSFWLIFQKIYFPVWDTSLKQERTLSFLSLPSWPLCSLPSSPLLAVRTSSGLYLPRSANREKFCNFHLLWLVPNNITFL